MESRGGRAGLQQQQQRATGGGGSCSGWVLVEARLQGGAPWGFTLQGGLEHGEPLIISKVEEGGKVDSLDCPLLVGDQIIIINEIELTGFRQEAIALVKGSYKTLQITVRREFYPGYIDVFGTSPSSFPSLPAPSPLSSASPSPVPQQIQAPQSYNHRSSCSAGGVQMRIKNKNREPASRPHSWHSTKLGDGHQEPDERGMEPMSSAWHHSYHTSASTTDLSGGFESGSSCLRKSPDQYSSRGSMESLDPPHSSHHHTAAQHPGHHTHGGPFPAYSSCQHLSSARSSNSIDHLHSKRDSAYSSFSTSSSIPDYLASTPSFSPERSFSLETVPQRGGEMQQADMRYIQTVYDAQQGFPQDQQLNINSTSDSEARAARGGRDIQGSAGGVCYRGGGSSSSSSSGSSSGASALNRHSVGPIWGPVSSHSSSENLRGAPAPPRRSDSYKAIRNHERPNSWSSLENARSLRSLQKGTWHHSSGPVASGTAKGSYGTECQLHTVIEKSPESSPTTKPRQGGGFPQPSSPPATSPGPPASAPQSGRPVLPTVVYPFPQPEPHYAQMPSSPATGVFPALMRDDGRQQQSIGAWDEELRRSTSENGYQMYSSSPQHGSSSEPAPAPLGAQEHEADSYHEDCNSGMLRSDMRRSEGRFEGVQRLQSHQGSNSTDSQRPNKATYDQDYHNHQVQSDPRSKTSQEWRDPYPPVQSRRERTRSMDQPSINQEPLTSPRVAQGQAPPTQFPFPHQSSSSTHSRHHSDLTDVQHQQLDQRDLDRDHPLTRLEMALTEVQQCNSPHSVASAGSCSNTSAGEGGLGPTRSLSVLEKVSRFERQERAGKQRSHSTRHGHTKSAHRSESGRSTPCRADDLRNMLERSTHGSKAQRTLSCRGGSINYMKNRTPSDPNAALLRSRSTFHLEESTEGGSSKGLPLRQDVKEVTGSMQDTTDNRHYRDSLKDAQSKVLRSTSFQRRDLTSSSSHSPSSSINHQQQLSFEKKGPKTKPKPQGIIITPQTSPPVTSPHVPKERHVVGPEVRGPSPPALPSVPPVGLPFAVTRICGRKRLTADQKKRSYSEPENMNEIGVSDPETVSLFRRGGETSVADRRKMFEAGASQNSMSKPDLRQLQHSALADYMERKRGVKKDEGGQRSGPRPRSAYIHSEGSSADTLSLSSTSSLLSLQDSDHSFSLMERHHSSNRPPAADLRSLQSNFFYPGRVTSPRPPANPALSALPEPHTSSSHISPSKVPDHQQLSVGVSRHLNGALQRAGSTLNAGKSASAEDLLERPEKHFPPQHSLSRSSPMVERLGQHVPPGRDQMFGGDFSGMGRQSLAEERTAGAKTSDDIQLEGSARSTTPVTHRERRQRNGERPRSHSTSTLAASVGLPCPLTPHRTQDQAKNLPSDIEQLRQANLDDISFPDVLQTRKVDDRSGKFAVGETQMLTKQTRHSLSDTDVTDTKKEPYRGRTFSLEMRGRQSEDKAVEPLHIPADTSEKNCPPPLLPPPPPPSSDHQPRLSSLRISESNLLSPLDLKARTPTGILQEDFDEVFLQNPAPASPPPAPEDFPPLPPPPPVFLLDQESPQETSLSSELVSRSPLDSPPVSPSSPVTPSPAPTLPPPQKPQPSTTVAALPYYFSSHDTHEAKQNLGIEYQLPPKREKTPEELRVETLAQQLVLQERSLAPLLDTCGGKSTVELVEEIFANSRSGGKASWQRRGSKRLDHRFHDNLFSPAQAATTEIDLDESDIDSLKLELCEALKGSVEALKQEKDGVHEEQKHHQTLGASVDSLVQKLCKSNEKEKYHMFIGDLDTVVNLLLSLCGRLSRIDRALLALQGEEASQEDAAEERESLYHKRSLLLRQTEDAWELKENLDRRQRVVHDILSGYLTDAQLQDYRHCVSTKPSLLIRRRNLDDLIRQAEERLVRLVESLPAEQAAADGWARGSVLTSQSSSALLPPALTSVPARSTTVTSL